mgnify:CR=1 FL=1
MLRKLDKWLASFQEYRKLRGALQMPVLLNSIPKSGTHLLSNMLFSIPHTHMVADLTDADKLSDPTARLEYVRRLAVQKEAGDLYIGHIPYSPEIAQFFAENGVKQVFVFREPRDVSVSMYHYVMKPKGGHYHFPLFNSMENDSQRLMTVIEGYGKGKEEYEVGPDAVPSLHHYYEAYLPWLNAPNTLALRFEDLISPDLKSATIQKLLNFLEVPQSEEKIQKMVRLGQNPKNSSTFRKGKAGSWAEEYLPEHHQAFEKVGGKDLLQKMGYE